MALANFGSGSVFNTSCFREPGAAGLQYPEANFVQVRGVVGIGIDHDLDAVLFRQPEMTVVQVKAIGIGIQFHGHLLSRGSFQHGLDIEGISIAAEQHASGGVADQRSIWIFHRLEQAVSHLGRALVEMGVHAGDDDVHLLEHGVGEVEGAVGQDVHFDAGKNCDLAQHVVHGANALDVFDGALVVEAVGKCQVLRVVGDGHVLVAILLGGRGHFFDGVAAVSFDGVHVDVALQVGLGDQIGQGMGLGGVDFTEIFAQLGRNVIELEPGVNLFLGFSRDRLFGIEVWPDCTR